MNEFDVKTVRITAGMTLRFRFTWSSVKRRLIELDRSGVRPAAVKREADPPISGEKSATLGAN